jgi:hypothetical protein
MRCLAAAVVLLLLAPGRSASGQTGAARLTGVVTDSQHAVLPGAIVVATSVSLIGEQSTITQSDGRYLFPALPSGVYTMVFRLDSFRTLVREGIVLSLGTTITVDAELTVSSLQESVIVSGNSPVVDVATTKVGMSLKGDALLTIPNSTDIWGVLSQAPGIRMQGFDVGGSHKSQQSAFEVFGIQNQIRVISDGIDHTESMAGTGFYEDYFANEEVSVSALGSDVEMNGGGAAIVTTVKSGGNSFRGLLSASYEPGRWVGDNVSPELAAQGFTGNPTLLFWETHADLGGPIRRDRAWFFYAFNHFTIDKVVSGVPRELGTDPGIFDNHTAKATWRPSLANSVIGYFQQGRKQKPRRGISLLRAPESVADQDTYSRMYKGEWQRVLSNRSFLDVIVGRFTLDSAFTTATDAAVNPPTFALDTGAFTGAPFNLGSGARDKPQLKAQLTHHRPHLTGSHDFKFGYEMIYDSYRFGANGVSGPIQYRTSEGVPIRVRFLDVGAPADYGRTWGPSPNVDLHHTGYAQDRWSPSDRVSITAGVRVDYQNASYKSGVRRPVISDGVFPPETAVAGKSLLRTTDTAVRLGATYDPTGQGRTVLKGYYGRYYNNLADSFSSANPGGNNSAEYNFNDLNRNQRYDGAQELGALRFTLGGATASVNPSLHTPYVEEFSGSLEHQFWGASSARLTLVRKNSRRFVPYWYSPYVPAWVGQLTVPTTVEVIGPSGRPETYNVFDIPDSLVGETDVLFDNIPGSDFHYTTIEFAFSSRRSSRFLANASVDYQWRNELRTADISNWGASDPLSTDPIGVNFFLNPNPAVANRQQTTTYHIQAFARYSFSHDVGVAANLRYQSGFAYSRIIPDGALPNVSPAPFFVENLDRHRSDNVALLNLRADKALRLRRMKLTAMVDLYNALNASPVTNFNLFNDDFGHVIAVLDPRVVQIGLRLEF